MLGFSPGIYNWLKAIHIPAAIVWVGGGIFVQIYATRLMRATDWQAKTSLAAMALLLLAPVAMRLVLWLRHTDPEPLALD